MATAKSSPKRKPPRRPHGRYSGPAYAEAEKRIANALSASSTKLDLSIEGLTRIPPLSGLTALQSLDLNDTQVSDLRPLSGLTALQSLYLWNTQVSDLTPLANLVRLIDGALKGAGSKRPGGLSFSSLRLADQILRAFSELDNPDCTIKTINYLRERQGLPVYEPRDSGDGESAESDIADLEPIEGLPAPFEYGLNRDGKIAVIGNPVNRPLLPLPRSKNDHAQRLEACRVHAEDFIQELGRVRNLRHEYLSWVKKYLARLPADTNEGNILLADAAARSLRNMFAAEADILSTPIASQLKTLLENYMGLRAFYPEVSAFQRDVREGRITEPLSLDAVDGFVAVVTKYTPEVFDRSVKPSIELASEQPANIAAPPPEDRQPTANQPMPPPDMMGDVDPGKAHDVTQATTLNRLWRAVRSGEQIYKSVHAWSETIKELEPWAAKIIRWLHEISPNGPPHH
jgi:hypothetical protein